MKRIFQRYIPHHERIRRQRGLGIFGERIYEPSLWHCNRRSVAGALGLGIFTAFIPVPMQTLIAAAGALLLRVNLPLSVLAVFISNPLTMGPIFYFTYRVGLWILGLPPLPFNFELSFEWLWHQAGAIWLPLFVGSLIVGIIIGLLTWQITLAVWWYAITRRRRCMLRQRQASRRN